jgi:large subunit ribosomal protein L21
MYAVIRSGGKQYRVAPGEIIHVERLEGKVGSAVAFDGVLAVRTDDAKMIAGSGAGKAKVAGKIVGHGRHTKRVVLKFKRCGQYKIMRGHRQGFTAVKVGETQLN